MKEQWQIKKAREICRKNKIRYQIKTQGNTSKLYLFSHITGHYMQICYDLLNYKNPLKIRDDIEKTALLYMC